MADAAKWNLYTVDIGESGSCGWWGRAVKSLHGVTRALPNAQAHGRRRNAVTDGGSPEAQPWEKKDSA